MLTTESRGKWTHLEHPKNQVAAEAVHVKASLQCRKKEPARRGAMRLQSRAKLLDSRDGAASTP